MKKLDRKQIANFAKILIGVGLVIFLIYYLEPKEIYQTYQKANKGLLLFALLLVPVNLFLQYFKWQIFSEKYFGIKEKGKVWVSLFYGISGGIFTPMKSGEYFARALPYKNAKVLDVVLATLVDKLIPIFFVALIGGTFFIVFLKSLLDLSTLVTVVLVVVYKISVFLPLYLLFVNKSTSLKLTNWLSSKKYFEKIINRIAFLKEMDGKTLTKLVATSFLYHLIFTSQMTILLSAFSGELSFAIFFFAANLIIFAQIVIPPIALGEVGVREGAAVYFLQNLGFAGAIGFNAAITLFFINLLIPSIIGFILLLRKQ